jgi:hypothetical protein
MKTKLSKIIYEHQSSSQRNQISVSIGDGYLLEHSSVFRKVRYAYVNRGFVYASTNYAPYFDCVLFSLNDIFRTKKIFVRKNILWLQRLEKQRPNFYSLRDIYSIPLGKNLILHESAHCVAFNEVFGTWKNFRSKIGSFDVIPRVLLTEAFANACEVLLQITAPKSPIEGYFRWMNVYFHISEQNRKFLKVISDKFELSKCAHLLILLFLYSNFLYKDLEKAEVDRIISIVGLEVEDGKRSELRSDIKNLASEIPFQLSISFRLQTSAQYFENLGYDKKITKLLYKNPGVILERDATLNSCLVNLAKLVSN